MPYHRKDKEDANAPKIIATLEAHGYEVTKTERPVDIHIYDPRSKKGGWAEIKCEGKTVTAKRHQLAFLSEARQPATIIKNEAEALIFASTFNGWDDKQKDAIASLLIKNPTAKLFTMVLIEKTLGNGSSTGSTQ